MSGPNQLKSGAGSDAYIIDSVARACDVLEAFSADGELLRLQDVSSRTGLNKTTAYRFLYTLERRGLIERVGAHQYRLTIKPLKRRKYRIGFGAESSEFSFSRDVSESVTRAAAQQQVELIVLNNDYSPRTALRNVDTFLRNNVDLVIEFQVDENVAPIISSRFLEAGIPFIAVEIPHPGATYFGADNYTAGLIGGRALGRWAKQRWHGRVEQVILLELRMAGSLPQSRLTGSLVGIREVLPEIRDSQILWLNGNGQFGTSLEVMRRQLRTRRLHQVLLAAINDNSALGALRAFEEAGLVNDCAIMGQNASVEGRAELRRPGTRLIGSVAYFPERYGEELIALALDILQRKTVPPAVFVKHQLITPQNVDHLYPNDALLNADALDAALIGLHKAERSVNRRSSLWSGDFTNEGSD